MHRVRRAGTILIVLTVLSLFPAVSRSGAHGETAAGGVIRVLLTQLRLTDRADIALDGSYETSGGLAFQRGSKLVVSCATGRLMLYYEGISMDSGDQLALLRHTDDTADENGLRINGVYSLYGGDLYLTFRDGMLRAVLHIPIEEYLLGVVPYEMSDSFPLEALKAQAVAARTYALSHTGGSGDYDVTDNTNDQVYRGYLASNTNAVRAVAETAGLCGFYKGTYAVCYYTASNGGQTELAENVWGNGDFGYLAMTDDPYDIENDESVIKTFLLYKRADSGSTTDDTFYALLEERLTAVMTERGYDLSENRFRITGISGVSVHTALYAAPSKLMSQMRFDLIVEESHVEKGAAEDEEINVFLVATATPVPVMTELPVSWSGWMEMSNAVSLDLPIFPLVEQVTGLSINSDNNEIFTVSDQSAYFGIESRRYGHGVGMSQRGAQWMAQAYGWKYDAILRFYYPGMTLGAAKTEYMPRPALAAEFLATPGPAASPTPRPTLMPVSAVLASGEYRVKVTLIGTDSSLNLRNTPGTYGSVIRTLYYGQELIVSEETADGWLKVRTDAAEGYVMAKFVEKVE